MSAPWGKKGRSRGLVFLNRFSTFYMVAPTPIAVLTTFLMSSDPMLPKQPSLSTLKQHRLAEVSLSLWFCPYHWSSRPVPEAHSAGGNCLFCILILLRLLSTLPVLFLFFLFLLKSSLSPIPSPVWSSFHWKSRGKGGNCNRQYWSNEVSTVGRGVSPAR